MSVAVTEPGLPPEERSTLFENTISKTRIGEAGPLLFKLPQLLSQLFHCLVGAPFRPYGLALCRFSVICQPGQEPLEHELRRLAQK